MNNKNKRRLGILLLIFGFILSGVSLAYWAGSVKLTETDHETGTIIIGEGLEAETELTLAEVMEANEILVPVGKIPYSVAVADSELVEEIEFTVDVTWKSVVTDAAKGTVGTLEFTYLGADIGGTGTFDSNTLLNVTITGGNVNITADDAAVTVTIKVTLDEPADAAEYNAIATKNVVLKFKAEVK